MATTTKTAARTFGFFLDGKWLTEGERFDVLAPHDGSVVGSSFRASAAHAEAAIAAAERAFTVTRKLPGFERQRILREISGQIRERREEFAHLMALEAGKPIKTARAEVDRGIFTFSVAAEEATRIGGEWLPMDWVPSGAGRGAIVRRFPLGPILAITPFNFPAMKGWSRTPDSNCLRLREAGLLGGHSSKRLARKKWHWNWAEMPE